MCIIDTHRAPLSAYERTVLPRGQPLSCTPSHRTLGQTKVKTTSARAHNHARAVNKNNDSQGADGRAKQSTARDCARCAREVRRWIWWRMLFHASKLESTIRTMSTLAPVHCRSYATTEHLSSGATCPQICKSMYRGEDDVYIDTHRAPLSALCYRRSNPMYPLAPSVPPTYIPRGRHQGNTRRESSRAKAYEINISKMGWVRMGLIPDEADLRHQHMKSPRPHTHPITQYCVTGYREKKQARP